MPTSLQNDLVAQFTGDVTTASTSVTVSTDLERGQVLNFTGAYITIRNKNGSKVERVKGNASAGTLTFTLRGLDQSDTDVEVPALKKSWKSGQIFFITLLSSQIIDKQNSNTYGAGTTQTFASTVNTGSSTVGGNISGAGDLTVAGATSEVNLTGAKRGLDLPSVTTAERLALTPINGKFVYDSTLGLNYQYTGGTWKSVDTGTSTPNASTTVNGTAQEAVATDIANGTGNGTTGARLFINPQSTVKIPTGTGDENKLPVILPIGNINQFVSGFIDHTYYAGETLTAGQAVFTENMNTFASVATSSQNIGDINNNTRIGFVVYGTGIAGSTMNLALKKTGTPSVTLTVRVETDNAGSPSGTLVNANATATVSQAGLTGSLVDTLVTFAGSFTATVGTKYWIVMSQTGDVISASNYYSFGYSANTSTMNSYKKYFMGWASSTATDIQAATTYNLTAAETAQRGRRVTAKTTGTITGVSRVSGSTVTTCYIKDSGGSLLSSSSTLVGDVFTLSQAVVAGTDYRVEFDKGGASYTFHYALAAVTSSLTNFAYVQGSLGGGDSAQPGEVLDIRSSVAASTSLVVPYVNSTLFTGSLLGKADATYSYKSDVYGVVAIGAAVGVKPYITLPTIGIDANQTSLTTNGPVFLTNTPGVLGSTAGTNKVFVGMAFNTTTVLLRKKILSSTTQVVGASPYTYQNAFGQPIQCNITGGTVSLVQFSRDNSNFFTKSAATNTDIMLQPGDYVKITHSSTPTMTIFYI